jgi:simple sugar transport system ATP-binding protein
MPAPAVALRQITRRFGPVVANRDVTLELAPGEIHALVGENGAGKSTLMRVLYGMIAPDSGTIAIDGRPVRIARPADAIRLGLGMVHQHFMLVDTLTVAENIVLGHEPGGRILLSRSPAEREGAALADRRGFRSIPRARRDAAGRRCNNGSRSLKALYHGARVLILDSRRPCSP